MAKRAGVSQPTVSLVLSRNPKARLSPETRDRVLKAAEELGYRPNVVARSLVSRRSFALAVIVPDIGDQFFADVVSGAERVASAQGYAVFLSELRGAPLEAHLETLRARQIDGVIVDAAGAASVDAQAFDGLNVVLVDHPPNGWPGVETDAEGAGRLAARHLLTLGHRRLAFLGPSADLHGFRMRERGFVRALAEAGITIPSGWLRRTPATLAGGQAAMRALLQGSGPRPTAVFCANDLIALGAHKACTQAGVSIPGAMSLVGCDDIAFAQLVTPELTTIAVPARELGARAARLLLRTLSGEEETSAARRPRPLPVRLVERGTTAPPAVEAA